MHNSKKRNGFTLIELLIVVAIIAILAAIAVPNFLEAQVRSKVARVHADMRTMSTAIALYRTDYNVSPIGINQIERLLGISRVENVANMNYYVFSRFTTPIAYITSIPEDPFTSVAGAMAGGSTYRPYTGYWYWNYDWLKTNATNKAIMANGFTWVLRGWGPSRAGDSPWEAQILREELIVNIYDPTNGTKSTGFIMRTNKGIYPG